MIPEAYLEDAQEAGASQVIKAGKRQATLDGHKNEKHVESPKHMSDPNTDEAAEDQDVPDDDEDTDTDSEYSEEREQARMEILARELGPFVQEFYHDLTRPRLRRRSLGPPGKIQLHSRKESLPWSTTSPLSYGRVSKEGSDEGTTYPPTSPTSPVKVTMPNPILLANGNPLSDAPEQTANLGSGAADQFPTLTLPNGETKTIWHVLHALPRSYLDPYQPLVSLSTLFRGALVPAIDYYHGKLGFLTSLIHENRSLAPRDFIPTSTAFVTFHNPRDARRCVR